MVPEAGLEPAHSEEFQILSLVRLPIPPLRHFIWRIWQESNPQPSDP